MSRNKVVTGIVFAVAAGAAALAAFLAHTTAGGSATATPRTSLFSAFSTTAAGPVDEQVKGIADDMGADAQDLASVRTFASGLGSFQSRLVAFSSFDGQNICYALLAAERTDPGMSYCYRPHDAGAPAGLAGEHFSVSGLESRTGPNLDVGTQVFGVAEDRVVGARLQVAGSWRKIAINNNVLYLDLPGVGRPDVGILEVTLSDGSTESHDLQTARAVPSTQ